MPRSHRKLCPSTRNSRASVQFPCGRRITGFPRHIDKLRELHVKKCEICGDAEGISVYNEFMVASNKNAIADCDGANGRQLDQMAADQNAKRWAKAAEIAFAETNNVANI